MKKVTAKELAKIMANKLNLDVQIDNFKDLKAFVEDIYTQFVTDYSSLEDQAFYHHEVNYPERIVEIPTDVLKAVFDEANEKFELDRDVENFLDYDNGIWYNTPKDIVGPQALINYADEVGTSMEEFLSYWKDVCKRYDCEIQVTAGTIDDGEYGNHMLKWSISADEIKPIDAFFEIHDDNGMGLMDTLYWLCENFLYDTFESFEQLGVELRYDNENAQVEMDMNGRLLCLQYKYGDKNNLFATYEDALESVKKYPIVYGIIPAKFKDKALTLAFLAANKVWVDKYNELREQEYQQDCKDAENGCFHFHSKGRFVQFTDNAFVKNDVDIGSALKDEDVLYAVLDSHCPFYFTSESYDEDSVVKVMNERCELAWYVFKYWLDCILEYPKLVEWLRVKYELYNDPHTAELAFCKCLSLIKPDNKKAILNLIASMYNDEYLSRPTETSNVEMMKKAFSMLDVAVQNDLVSRFYSCVKFVNKNVLDKTLEQDIVNKCPIAGDILSDEAILKYNLKQSETDADVDKKCEECENCVWRHMQPM